MIGDLRFEIWNSASGDRPDVVLSAFWFDDAFPTLAMNLLAIDEKPPAISTH